MIKITVTSKDTTTGFAGAIELIYGAMLVGTASRQLVMIDMRAATLNQKQLEWIMAHVPWYYGDGYVQAWTTDKLHIVESEVKMEFERDFWIPYGMKVHKEIVYTSYWEKMTEADRVICCVGMMAYLRHLSKYPWKSKMLPKSWFKNKGWLTDWDNVNH